MRMYFMISTLRLSSSPPLDVSMPMILSAVWRSGPLRPSSHALTSGSPRIARSRLPCLAFASSPDTCLSFLAPHSRRASPLTSSHMISWRLVDIMSYSSSRNSAVISPAMYEYVCFPPDFMPNVVGRWTSLPRAMMARPTSSSSSGFRDATILPDTIHSGCPFGLAGSGSTSHSFSMSAFHTLSVGPIGLPSTRTSNPLPNTRKCLATPLRMASGSTGDSRFSSVRDTTVPSASPVSTLSSMTSGLYALFALAEPSMSPMFMRKVVRRPSLAVLTVTVQAAPNADSLPIPFRPMILRPPADLSVPSSSRLFLPIWRYLSAMSSYDMPVPSSATVIVESFLMGPPGSRISTFLASASQEFATISDMTGGSLPYSFMPRSSMTGRPIFRAKGACSTMACGTRICISTFPPARRPRDVRIRKRLGR